MTDIHHNAPDDVLMGYATGALPQAFDLVVATHVSLSDEARARLESFDAIGGALLDDLEEVPLQDDSFEKTLARVSGSDASHRPVRSDGVFPAPLQQIVGGDLESVHWRTVAAGVKQAVLHSDEGGTPHVCC